MKAETASCHIIEVAFEAVRDTAECHILPGNVFRQYQAYLEAFFACRVICRGETPSIEEVDLIYVRDADHREWCVRQ